MPAAPPSSRSVISALNPLDSAHIRYIRISISDQSQASVPPAPAWIVTNALQWSFGPLSIERNSNAVKSASACLQAARISSSNSSVSASSASSIVAWRLSAWRTRASNGLRTVLRPFSSCDDGLGLLLVVPEGRAVHLLLERVAMRLLFAEVKESLAVGGSCRSRLWPFVSVRRPREAPDLRKVGNGPRVATDRHDRMTHGDATRFAIIALLDPIHPSGTSRTFDREPAGDG